METKLSDYATGKTRYVKMFSIALSRIPSMYDELGSYIEKKIGYGIPFRARLPKIYGTCVNLFFD